MFCCFHRLGKLGDFRADALATLAWSMGRSTIRDGVLLDAIATRSIEILDTKDGKVLWMENWCLFDMHVGYWLCVLIFFLYDIVWDEYEKGC